MLGTIDIGGKARPFKFGWNAIAAFGDLRGLDVQQCGEALALFGTGKHTLSDLRDVMFCGLSAGAAFTRTAVDFTNTDVGDWMDDMTAEDMAKAMNLLGSSFSKKKAAAPAAQETLPA